jgi:hypothetical protein
VRRKQLIIFLTVVLLFLLLTIYSYTEEREIIVIKDTKYDYAFTREHLNQMGYLYKPISLKEAINKDFEQKQIIIVETYSDWGYPMEYWTILGKSFQTFVKNGGMVIIQTQRDIGNYLAGGGFLPEKSNSINWIFSRTKRPSSEHLIKKSDHPIFKYLSEIDREDNKLVGNFESYDGNKCLQNVDEQFILLTSNGGEDASIIEIEYGQGTYIIVTIQIDWHNNWIDSTISKKLMKGIAEYAINFNGLYENENKISENFTENRKSDIVGNLRMVVTTTLTSVFSNARHNLIVTIDGPIHQSQTFEDIGTATPVSVYFNNIPEGHYKIIAKYASDTITKEIDVYGDTYEFQMMFY